MAVTASTSTTTVIVKEDGAKGDPGTNGTDGAGFNQVRKSLIDNPLCHLFKTNKLVESSAPTGTDSDVTHTRSTTATYVDRYGVVKTAAINTLREEKKGVLIEGASTNELLYSEQLDDATWIKSVGASIVTNSTPAPDGNMSADTVNLASVGDNVFQVTSVATSNNTVTFSFWLKGIAGQTISVDLTNQLDDVTRYPLTLTADWVRYEVTKTFNSTVANATVLFVLDVGQTASSFFAWGAQLEQLPFASSYIPTTTATVTRTEDSTQLVIKNNLPDLSDKWSIHCNVKSEFSAQSTLLSNTLANKFLVFFGNGSITIADDANTATFTGQSITENTVNNVVITYDETDLKVYIDGVLAFSDTRAFVFNSQDEDLFIGKNIFSNHLNGTIKDLIFYDFALNQGEVTYLSGA